MIIGLHGKARAGKDTSYQFIDEFCAGQGIKVEQRSFAFPLKISALAALGIDTNRPIEFCDVLKQDGSHIETVWYDEEAQQNRAVRITGREYLQNYGTEAHRDVFGEDFWVNACLPESTANVKGVVVVTDVRFPNEAWRIKELGGVVWYIDRPSENNDTHASEQRLPDRAIDATIRNHGSLEDLRASVIPALREVLSRRVEGDYISSLENDQKVPVNSLPG